MLNSLRQSSSDSDAIEDVEVTAQSTGELFYIKGVHPTVDFAKLATRLERSGINSTLCVEAHSMESFEARYNIYHISDFAPETGEPSPREGGRNWVTELSLSVLEATGKPVWQSFDYKGISAWWFLEILFHEPAYLVERRRQAIGKAVRKLGKKSARELNFAALTQLPTVPESIEVVTQRSFRRSLGLVSSLKKMNEVFLQLNQRRFLERIKQSDVFCIIEHENLRRHLDSAGQDVETVLPYAEGVIETLREQLGDKCLVLSRRIAPESYEGWDFLESALPPLVLKPLPALFEAALSEIFQSSLSIIGDYFSLDNLREIMILRLAEYDLYLQLLQRVHPKVLFLYNWEGVFRPLTTAARFLGCRVVGVQQALGPYLHALDHREVGYFSAANPQGFAIPDKVAAWGEFHARKFADYGYAPSSIAVTGYARLDKHGQVAQRRQSIREQTCRLLKLPLNARYLLFTGQSRVLDTVILRDESFIATLDCLCSLAAEFDFKIIMKPWASDDLDMFQKTVSDNPGLVFVAPQNVLVSNAALLSVCDWLVGTFSSIIGEASLTGTAGVMLDYLESRYYFDLPHVEIYRSLVPFVGCPEELDSVLRPIIENESARAQAVQRARVAMGPIFGPCDSQAASRIAELVLTEAGR